jgi:hypothetical protein
MTTHPANNPGIPETKFAGQVPWWHTAWQAALIALWVVTPLLVAFWCESHERHVCARVLAIDQDGAANVEYWWEGRRYSKSLASDHTFKPAGKATIGLYFVGSPENAVRDDGAYGPYVLITFLVVGGFVAIVFRVTGSGKAAPFWSRIVPSVKAILDLVIRRLGRKPTAKARVFLCAAVAFVCMGTLNTVRHARRPGRSPDRLGRAFLAAVHERDLNKAAWLVAYDQRYDFMSDAPLWVLRDYEIIEVSEDTIRFRHVSDVNGKPTAGESALPIIQNPAAYSGYWIGHVSVPVSKTLQ